MKVLIVTYNIEPTWRQKNKSRQIKKTCGLGVPLESPVELVPASLYKFCLLLTNRERADDDNNVDGDESDNNDDSS